MSLILIFKLLVIIVFLVMFLRRPSLPWGVGLLTVTTAVLLDTIFGTFNQEQLRADLGFFFYVIIGILLGGGIFWLLGLLWPILKKESLPGSDTAVMTSAPPADNNKPITLPRINEENGAVYDLQMIYEDMQSRLDREDILDVMFDMQISEEDVPIEDKTTDAISYDIVQYAQAHNQVGLLALAVERTLTPPAPETLPRLEKITPDSPRTILRYYLLAHSDQAQLTSMAAQLHVDMEQLDGRNKRAQTRALLQYLYNRSKIDELLQVMKEESSISSSTADENVAQTAE